MWEAAVEELLVLERNIFRKLNETYCITQELAEAVSRGDQVSVQMLVSTRQSPVLELQELRAAVDLKRCDLSGEDVAQFDRLMNDRGMPENDAEREVKNQIDANRRILEQLVALDRRVNSGVCREHSIYHAR